MQLIQAIEIDPEKYVAEEHERTLRPPDQCPHCGGIKTLWALGYYVRHLSRMGPGALSLSIRRFRCCGCKKTVSILPAFAQPYRFVQNRTIELFARGAPYCDEVIRHIDVLSHYWKRFCNKRAELERTLIDALGRAPPNDPKKAWASLVNHFQGLDGTTRNLTSHFQITLFGRYRCHRPNEEAAK